MQLLLFAVAAALGWSGAWKSERARRPIAAPGASRFFGKGLPDPLRSRARKIGLTFRICVLPPCEWKPSRAVPF